MRATWPSRPILRPDLRSSVSVYCRRRRAAPGRPILRMECLALADRRPSAGRPCFTVADPGHRHGANSRRVRPPEFRLVRICIRPDGHPQVRSRLVACEWPQSDRGPARGTPISVGCTRPSHLSGSRTHHHEERRSFRCDAPRMGPSDGCSGIRHYIALGTGRFPGN
jgi:hypothetical protein